MSGNEISYKELKELYSKRKIGCGKGYFGKIYNPKGTETDKVITPVTKYKEIEGYWRNKKGDLFYGGYEIHPEKYKIEKNVTKDEQFLNLICNSWVCNNCRPILKSRLYDNSIREVNRADIKYHLITTFKGGKYRKMNYAESYPIMAKEFVKLMQSINYAIYKLRNGKELRTQNTFLREGNTLPDYDLAYIKYIRSQNHPKENNPIGFCHYHTGLNYSINIKWIGEIINKNNLKLGHNWITENQNFTEYLMGDFLTDEEYIIPFNVKHYSTSKNININASQGNEMNPESILFIRDHAFKKRMICGQPCKRENIEEYLINGNYTVYDVFGENLEVKNSVTLPFEEYVKQFQDKYRLMENKDNNIISLYVIRDIIPDGWCREITYV